MGTQIKGLDEMLTPEDIAALIKRPKRFVLQRLIKTQVIRSVKFGGNSYRVTTRDFQEFLLKGQTSFRHAPSSGGRPK